MKPGRGRRIRVVPCRRYAAAQRGDEMRSEDKQVLSRPVNNIAALVLAGYPPLILPRLHPFWGTRARTRTRPFFPNRY